MNDETMKMVYRLYMCCGQYRPSHYAFRGRDKSGRLRSKAFHPSGNRFLRWSLLGEFPSYADALEIARRFHDEDPVNNYEFILHKCSVATCLLSTVSLDLR